MFLTKKQIRQKFRSEVFKRDKHKCVFCDKTENLDAHHIIDRNKMPNGGYIKENGITLCPEHHLKAEKWHQSNYKDWEEGFHPNDLFEKIKSPIKLHIKNNVN